MIASTQERNGRFTVGEDRPVVAAAPRYLAQHPRVEEPGDLAKHQIIAFADFGPDSWSFPPLPGSSVPRTVQFTPRLVINSVRGAVASAVDGRGVTRVFSYQVAEHVREGALEIVLAGDEYPPLPVHVISPHGRLSVPKVRAFVDFAVPRLRSHFARLAKGHKRLWNCDRSAEECLPNSEYSLPARLTLIFGSAAAYG